MIFLEIPPEHPLCTLGIVLKYQWLADNPCTWAVSDRVFRHVLKASAFKLHVRFSTKKAHPDCSLGRASGHALCYTHLLPGTPGIYADCCVFSLVSKTHEGTFSCGRAGESQPAKACSPAPLISSPEVPFLLDDQKGIRRLM